MPENKEFFKEMERLGYTFLRSEDACLTYVKEKRDSELYLVIHLKKKYVNAICVPSQLILYEKDLSALFSEFKELRADAKYIADRAKFKLLGDGTSGNL